MFCYYNDGTAMKVVAAGYVPASGEQVFDAIQTPTQLTAAFFDYASTTNDDSIKAQIAALEAAQTPRMYREAADGSTAVFKSGTQFAGLTSTQALSSIETQIATLRSQLT